MPGQSQKTQAIQSIVYKLGLMLRPAKQEEVAQTIPEEEMPRNEVWLSESVCVRNGCRKGWLFTVLKWGAACFV